MEQVNNQILIIREVLSNRSSLLIKLGTLLICLPLIFVPENLNFKSKYFHK